MSISLRQERSIPRVPNRAMLRDEHSSLMLTVPIYSYHLYRYTTPVSGCFYTFKICQDYWAWEANWKEVDGHRSWINILGADVPAASNTSTSQSWPRKFTSSMSQWKIWDMVLDLLCKDNPGQISSVTSEFSTCSERQVKVMHQDRRRLYTFYTRKSVVLDRFRKVVVANLERWKLSFGHFYVRA